MVLDCVAITDEENKEEVCNCVSAILGTEFLQRMSVNDNKSFRFADITAWNEGEFHNQ